MSITSIFIYLSSIHVLALGKSISVPQSICFEPFNRLDCGGRPIHVLYYYKPGSRCEIGIWRGCPTRNMFQDEYDCIHTCIFTEQAKPEEYHNFGNEDYYQLQYGDANKTIDKLVATTVAVDDGYETDDEGEANSVEKKDTIEPDSKETGANREKIVEKADGEKADDENPDSKNTDGENADGDTAEGDNGNEAGEGDKEPKVDAKSEGETEELGSEDIGAN